MLQGLASGNLVNNKNPKVGSLFASDSSEPKMIFRFFSIFLSIFWCNAKVGLLFASDNSDSKIIFNFFFENVMSISIFELAKNMKDQLSGQLKMLIVRYTAGHITLIHYSQVIMYLLF